jgi:hypothetical protein
MLASCSSSSLQQLSMALPETPNTNLAFHVSISQATESGAAPQANPIGTMYISMVQAH